MFDIGRRYTITMIKPIVGTEETLLSCEAVEENMSVVKFNHLMDGELIINTASPCFVKAVPEAQQPVSIQISTGPSN